MAPARTMVLSNIPAVAQAAQTADPGWQDVRTILRQVGMRLTPQRMLLASLLFGKGDRHLTAEML
jgi:Fur family iron response transcriptional regulator